MCVWLVEHKRVWVGISLHGASAVELTVGVILFYTPEIFLFLYYSTSLNNFHIISVLSLRHKLITNYTQHTLHFSSWLSAVVAFDIICSVVLLSWIIAEDYRTETHLFKKSFPPQTARSSALWSSCNPPSNFVNGQVSVHGLLLSAVVGWWLGKIPFVQVCTTRTLPCLDTVQQRTCLTSEIVGSVTIIVKNVHDYSDSIVKTVQGHHRDNEASITSWIVSVWLTTEADDDQSTVQLCRQSTSYSRQMSCLYLASGWKPRRWMLRHKHTWAN